MKEILDLVNGMSPYLLLGFLIAGVMHAFVPGKLYSRYLAKNDFRSVVNAALLGIPIPLCSCGVIPAAMSLRREGASKGAVVSFLIATPQTGADSVLATYSLMGCRSRCCVRWRHWSRRCSAVRLSTVSLPRRLLWLMRPVPVIVAAVMAVSAIPGRRS